MGKNSSFCQLGGIYIHKGEGLWRKRYILKTQERVFWKHSP